SSATACVKGGRLAIKEEHLRALERADRIFVVTDMDEPGQKCAAAFPTSLPNSKVFRVSWEYEKGFGPKDIGEIYIQAHTEERFKRRIEQLRTEALNRPPEWRTLFKSRDEMQTGPINFLIENFLPQGITFVGALSGAGKSWFATSMSKALT